MEKGLTAYELASIAQIHDWKDPSRGKLEKTMSVINWPAGKASDLVSKIPGVDFAMGKSVGGLVKLLNDFAHWSVRREAVYAEYRKQGFEVNQAEDIFQLDLENVDRVIGWLDTKYISLASGEGAASGFIGAFGLPTDVVALVTLNLRAIGEYATYCGFDTSNDEERLFAMNILFLASSPTDRAKQKTMAQLVRIARDVSAKHAMSQFQQNAIGQVIQQFAKGLGRRLTRSKFSQFLPVAGSLVGGGSNALYTSKVCKAASNLYRERFLAEKYGTDMIELTVEPAEDLTIDDS